MVAKPGKPAPVETDPSKQKDDNIDALGRKPDGSRQEQPARARPRPTKKP